MAVADDSRLEELTDAECLEFLAHAHVGRLALADGDDGPLVVPVNYVVDGRAVVFRTAAGSKLARIHEGLPVSFQVDEIDHRTHAGWSVLVRGTAYEAAHWEVAHLVVAPWAPGDRSHYVRVRADRISGRRLHPEALPWVFDSRAYL